MKVYATIARVTGKLAKEGIAKARRNKDQNFQFRGIDDVYNVLSRILSDEGLNILPRVLSREVTVKATRNGGAMNNVVVEVEFDLVCAEDGSRHTIKTFGEAMDTADKATNKAMSAAMKYACLMAFQIPTEGDNDADAVTPEVAGPAAGPADEGETVALIRSAVDLRDLVKIGKSIRDEDRTQAVKAAYRDMQARLGTPS